MQKIFFSLCLAGAFGFSGLALADTSAPSVEARLAAHIDSSKSRFQEFYEDIHRNPELSNREMNTAPKVAAGLARAGFEVTTGVGGYGVVGVLRNGAGPTIMVRTDMDALPIQEETGVMYASQVPGVMHACGHDLHMAMFLGAAEALSQMRDQWRGTLVFIGQPAEEIVAGARAMIADGLFTRFPRPDFALAIHAAANMPSGKIGFRAGPAMAAADSVDVVLRGMDAHGSAPHAGIDPIVLGAEYVLKMNGIVSREVNPLQPAVITVGSFHGGTKHNIIPASVRLQMTVRNFDEGVRAFLKERIVQVAAELSQANRSPAPQVDFPEGVGVTVNEPMLVGKIVERFRQVFPSGDVFEMPPILGAEDFSEYGLAGGMPTFLWFVGAARNELPTPWPGAHTSKYAPDFAAAWPMGVRSMTNAVLALQPALGPELSPIRNAVGGRGTSTSFEATRFTEEEIKNMIYMF